MTIRTGRLRFGPENGRLLLRTGRTGVGSTVGHDLTIEVTEWSVEVTVPETGPADATATARVELGSLAVRTGTGGARPLTDKDRRDVENNARRTLDVNRHPTATFESTRVVAGDDSATISGTLTLHGIAAPITVEVRAAAPDRHRATTVVTQSTYGIKPYSAFLGALKVRDDVEVEIEFDLRR
ncbi:YceI family protein [Micromonospora sp. WMMD812]|uniref:YceI family protein n=1 Tax=Micromonospora sp. WMMD812 TaxID=3015152 RepID=UPI00248B928E|nr:YceI family protein [Micromonospora sp. WMMD812]WBB68283.1 YceI family protein [Micromonospora sp. WMMD812]